MTGVKILIQKDHYFLTVGQDIDQLLTPLKKYGIITLTFMRNYDDGHQVVLSNNSDWVEDYYHGGLCGNFLSKHPSQYHQKFLVIPNESPHLVHQLSREKYQEGNTFCLVNRFETFTEFFFFAGNVNDSMLTNFCINNIDLLETFTVYFKSCGEHAIEKAEKSRLSIVSKVENSETHSAPALGFNDDMVKETLRYMGIKHFKISDENVKLTRREIDCIAACQQDLSAKETAILLDLSFRSVEKYIETINQKLNFNDKKESLRYLIEKGFPKKILTYATYKTENPKQKR
ncbi:MAG: LuxR C-terminal-related transcriptional regulator [Pseudomonadota bacterium]|nr:LuxR C-terminal-related transcriptional regulator [Pseudomonadota bacterium]